MSSSEFVVLLCMVAALALSAGAQGGQPEPTVHRIAVRCSEDTGKLPHFWSMTGFDHAQIGFPAEDAEWALSSDQRQQIIYMGAVPNSGYTLIRAHNLLCLIRVKGAETGNRQYDWSGLDKVLDLFTGSGFKPFFEMMGIPTGLDVGKYDQLNISPEGWRVLSRDLARHLIERYGRDEVRSWFFEVWNEPDNWDLETLCNYYDGCSEGFKEADPALRWGGPGTWNTLFDLFKGLLTHCESGRNHITGETGTRMDFISVHEKGIKRSDFYDGHPDVKEWIDRQIATIRHIRDNHPRFAKTLFVNDECDPKGGWWNTYSWRDTAYFPALVSKYMNHCLRRIVDPMDAEVIMSNDNAFIGEWGKRSHVARFGDHYKFELVKKPVNAGMVALSLLGDRQCELRQPDLFSDVGAIASSRGKEQIAVLVYNCNEAATREKHDDAKWVLEEYGTARVRLSLEGLPFKEGVLAHYRIDKDHTNPYEVWRKLGSPESPTAEQYERMRTEQELALLEKPREVLARDGKLEIEFDLPMPGVSLVLLSAKPEKGPGQVTGLRAEVSPGLLDRDEALVVWKGLDCRTIRTYEVLCSESSAGPYKRVNKSDLLCTAFLHVRDTRGGGGFYKVRAVDYRGRTGKESEPVASPI